MCAFELHRHDTDEIARQALRLVARSMRTPVLHRFLEGDLCVTRVFWEVLEESHPGVFSGVDYCLTCRKFVLYPATQGGYVVFADREWVGPSWLDPRFP